MTDHTSTEADRHISTLLSQHDCWDIGSGLNSLEWMVNCAGIKKPIGINIEEERLNGIIEGGFPALRLNAFDLPDGLSTSAITMCHFLEHLNDDQSCEKIIDYAISHASDLIIISGPYFEDDTELRKFGYKFNWGAWDDHQSRYSANHIINFLQKKIGSNFSVSVGFGVNSTSAINVFCVDDLDNQGDYVKGKHKNKPTITLPRPMYQEFMICISPNGSRDTRVIHERRHGPLGILQHEILRQFGSSQYYVNGLLHQFER